MKLSRVLSALILGGVCTFTATSVLAQDIKQRIVRFGYGLNLFPAVASPEAAVKL